MRWIDVYSRSVKPGWASSGQERTVRKAFLARESCGMSNKMEASCFSTTTPTKLFQTFQPNTRAVIAFLPYGVLFTAIFQSIDRLFQIAGVNLELDHSPIYKILKFLGNVGITLRYGYSICLLSERVIATVKVDYYESYCSKPPFVAVIILGIYTIIGITANVIYVHPEIFTQFAGVYYGLTVTATSIAVYLILPRWSLRVYNRHLRMIRQVHPQFSRVNVAPSLSQRYQSKENLRISRFLKRLSLMEWVFGTMTVFSHMVAKLDTGGAFRHYIYIAGAYYFSMTTTLISIQFIQQRVKTLRSEPSTALANLNPEAKVNPERANDMYFDIYAKQW
ncbi:unnamed protein product [Bursaphelenchus xylophilus]|uniref:(pine wood nematode) hypothetical protein n=1 Tax=Bursaphelenchus xylophilus TaxID=6326 RepID=A0A7I8WXB1_BURXY|nr:unnamed protein product [Bursaphelenchus xylophilus]CAG9100194.1 unnamed protein product [Bursaphelenchus xylophilus]